MKKVIGIGLMITMMSLLFSCYYDKEELLYGNAGSSCDTLTTVSYTKDVIPIFDQYCYSCHTGGFPSGNIAMGTYATDRAIALNGKLYGSVNHASGYSPMPQGTPKLNACQLRKIKLWIDGGSLNN